MADTKLYSQGDEALRICGTDPIAGLSKAGVERSLSRFGSNRLTPPSKDPIWKQYLEKFTDPTIIILCVCAVIAVGIGIYRSEIPWDGVAILVAVCLATAGGTFSEYKADKAFELLKKDSDNIPVKVTRDDQFHVIPSTELVVGDLIHVEGGDKIPADASLISSIDLMVDESLMTGESAPVHKGASSVKLVAGTHVVIGSGLAVVTAVGDSTELGNLASALGRGYACPETSHSRIYKEPGQCSVCGQPLEEREEGETPLQQKLGVLAGQISVWGTYTAIFIFVALLASAVFGGKFGDLSPAWRTGVTYVILGVLGFVVILLFIRKSLLTKVALWGGSALITAVLLTAATAHGAGGSWLTGFKIVLDYFMVAVTIVVVAVPEGLPMAVTIALGFSMRKIRQDNNLVRKMLAAETIGSVHVICSDKTGTLTKNQMQVQQVYLDGYSLRGADTAKALSSPSASLLSLACAVNSTAEIEHVDGQTHFIGNPTEGALLLWLEQNGKSYATLRSQMPIHSRACFTAERKMMTTLSGHDTCSACLSCPAGGLGEEATTVVGQQNGCRIVFTKGAPDRILPLCSSVQIGGSVKPIGQFFEQINAAVSVMADAAVRPLAIAYRLRLREDVDEHDATDTMETGLTLLAVFGLSDPVREDVPEALALCGSAGIEVKMITGDFLQTAEAIGRQMKLLAPGDITMQGEAFRHLADREAIKVLPRLRILARSEPSDKERMVRLLQEQGMVVAVTGDGTNDAPALRRADVGISMGLRGTDVAKEASDIVLTDDNFGSIVRAVHWGRTLYENIQKFLQFQLTVNLSALGVAFLSPILATLFPSSGFQVMPLTVLQYLWINLIMDTLAAIAFGLEPPRPETMRLKPKNRDDSFLTSNMLTNIVVLGGYFVVLILILQGTDLLGVRTLGPDAVASVVFTSYVWFMIFHMFNARSVLPGRSAFAGAMKSRGFITIMCFVVVMQVVLTQFGGGILRTVPLPLWVWGKILFLGATALVVGEALRFLQRKLARVAMPAMQTVTAK